MTPNHILTKNFLAVGRSYFDRIAEPSLRETQHLAKPIITTYTIAGKTVRVIAYAETMARVLSLALAHHSRSESEPDLTIHAWDSTTAGKDLVAPWDDELFDKEASSNELAKKESFFGVYVGGEESLNFYDPTTKTGYFWTHDAAQLPDWVLGAPFRTILHWFFNESDIHLIHGAVVGSGGKSVLLTAKSGSGKSTTALSCLLAGMDYLADDYVAVTADRGVAAHSLYHSAKVTREGLGFFPELRDGVWNKEFGSREKAVMFINNLFPGQVKTTADLSAILIPKITGGTTRLVPATKLGAVLAIAPTTLLQLPLAETSKVRAFKSIIDKIPCYYLELGPDIRAIPKTITSFLNDGTLG